MLHIVLWKWSQPGFRCTYGPEHVNTLVASLERNLTIPYRVVCVTDDPVGLQRCDTFPIWSDHATMRNASGRHLPSCYRRLKIFSSDQLAGLGIGIGDKVVSMDLDTVVVQNIDDLFVRDDEYVGWAVPGTRHPKVYNGSMFMFVAGMFDWMWEKFDPLTSPQRAAEAGFFGSDQAYMTMQLLKQACAGDWTASDGVLSYVRDVRANMCLPSHARIVMFHGQAKPWHADVMQKSPWITRYWRQ
jgi:hypothetical protein